MMIPDDVGIRAFHGDAGLKATLLERLHWYEAEGDVKLKVAVLQEQWSRRAQNGVVLNPYPKIARAEDAAGIRISGEVSTLYVLDAIKQSRMALVGNGADRRIYGVQYAPEDNYNKLLGVPQTLVSLLKVISDGLTSEKTLPWQRQFWAALPVGASVWRAPMRIVVWALSDPTHGILGLSAPAQRDAGVQAVRDMLALYQDWQAGGSAASPDWFSFYSPLESIVKNGRHEDESKSDDDLTVSERSGLLAAASAARTASVEENVVNPLPKGQIAIQMTGDSLDAPGKAILQAGLHASERGIDPSVWYEACASVLLDILAECPVPDRPSG